jgi:Fanconi anemia group M protein
MQKPKIIIDNRECQSGIHNILNKKTRIKLTQLPVGDYIVSNRIAIERKTWADFLDSLIKKRVFNQIIRLSQAYEKSILLIENENNYNRNVNVQAIYGALSSFVVDYNVNIIQTRNIQESASFIYTIAKREQFKMKKEFSLRGDKPKMTLKQRQQFIVEGLPHVSAVRAQKLLEHFGSVKNIMNTNMKELQEVDGIGQKISESIIAVLEEKWKSDKNSRFIIR